MAHFVYLVAGIVLMMVGFLVPIFKYIKNKNCIDSCLLSISFSLVYYMGLMLIPLEDIPFKTIPLAFRLQFFLMAIIKYGILFFFIWLIPFLKKFSFEKATAFATGFASLKLILFGLVFLLGVGDDACNPGFLSTLSHHYHNDFFAFLSDMRFKHYWTLLVLVVERISIFFIDLFLIVIFLYAFKRKNIILFVFVILYETFVNKIADIFNNTTCIELLDFSIYKTVILTVILALISGIIARSLKNRWQEDNLKTES